MRTAAVLICLSTIALSAESIASVRWTAPAGWRNEGARPMRAATYAIPAVQGDHDAAECGVYFFGAGQGGSIEANIERWKSQFHGAAGKPAVARIGKRTIHGLAITTIDTSGEYSGMGGPMATAAPVAGYRLIGAIVEAPGGNVFIKFTGPRKTVAANEQKFEQLLASLEKEK